MVLWPSAKEAIATARMVCDLEAGITTSPLKRDLFTINFIANIVILISKWIFNRSNDELKEVFSFGRTFAMGSPH
jgi:hypothetical protein